MSNARVKALQERALAAVKQAKEIAEKAVAEGRELTPDEAGEYKAAMERSHTLSEQLKAAKRDADILEKANEISRRIGVHGTAAGLGTGGDSGYLSLDRKSRAAAATRITAQMMGDDFGTKALVSAGAVISTVPMDPEPVALGRPARSVLELVPLLTRAANYSYMRQTTRTNNAATVAVGAAKPASVFSLTPIEERLRIVAHLSEPMHTYWFKDAVNLQAWVEHELYEGLFDAVEELFLDGDGQDENPTGLLQNSGIQTQAFTTDLLTTTRKAVTLIETSGQTPGAFVFSPTTWESLELARTSTAGELELGGPVDRAERKLWGVPVAVSTRLPEDTAALIDTSAVALSWDGQIETKWSENVSDDFSKNQLRGRCEGRFGVDVLQPLGVVKISTAAAVEDPEDPEQS